MTIKFIETGSLTQLEHILNGGVTGGAKLPLSGGKVLGLHGLTLILGGGTTTFSDATGAGLSLKEVKTAIEAGAAGTKVLISDGTLSLVKSTPTTPITVVKTGTANSIFGFSSSADTVGTVYATNTTPPRLIAVTHGPRADSYFATVEV
jgi:hypothetical protein